jgi:UDPglucose 6-dehydrogenase
MTHLGLCSAVAAASQGFQTLGFDPDTDLVRRLEAGKLPVIEPDLDRLLRENRKRIQYTADPARLRKCELIYIAPDVPTDDSGASELTALDRLLELALAHSTADAVVVVLSQVPPGYTRARQRSGRIICYQVETLVFGRAVERATKPEHFIVGLPQAAQSLPGPLEKFLQAFGCPILPMRLESAELTKISINCCLAASISVANTLAELCERIGADWAEIAPALKLDRRIGAHSYLTPGLGLAGGNLERDLATVIRFSEEYGTDAGVIGSFVANSSHRKYWALRMLHEAILCKAQKPTLAILGLAYKENTHSVKNSPALALVRHLAPWPIRVYDPVVPASAVSHPAATGAKSALEAVHGADALVIMTPWPEFRGLSPVELAKSMRGSLVVDPYRVLNHDEAVAAGLDHRTLGISRPC